VIVIGETGALCEGCGCGKEREGNAGSLLFRLGGEYAEEPVWEAEKKSKAWQSNACATEVHITDTNDLSAVTLDPGVFVNFDQEYNRWKQRCQRMNSLTRDFARANLN
jgi:hypothetical protein